MLQCAVKTVKLFTQTTLISEQRHIRKKLYIFHIYRCIIERNITYIIMYPRFLYNIYKEAKEEEDTLYTSLYISPYIIHARNTTFR